MAYSDSQNTSPSYTFDIVKDGVHITSAIIVENGISRQLTQEEYIELISHEDANDRICTVNESLFLQEDHYRATNGYTYSFSPTSCRSSWDYSLQRRVSPIYENATYINITSTTSFTRTVTNSGGITITSSIWPTIDSSVQASYSYVTTATSSTSTSVTGQLSPSGNYRYAAAVFTPLIATISGVLTETLSAMGSSGSTSHNCTFRYPATVSNLLDGIYSLYESNSLSSFPAAA